MMIHSPVGVGWSESRRVEWSGAEWRREGSSSLGLFAKWAMFAGAARLSLLLLLASVGSSIVVANYVESGESALSQAAVAEDASVGGRRSRAADWRPNGPSSMEAAPSNRSLAALVGLARQAASEQSPAVFYIRVTAIHVDKAEFPLSNLLFQLTLKLALEAVEKKLEARRVKLRLSIRSANTCSHQYASGIAAEEYYTKNARLFIVSGCDDAIRGVSRLAGEWQVPVMTAAGFGADLDNKSVHKTLIRVAFSLRAAVDFLLKIMDSFQWRRVNLIVDESDANSLALKDGIEKHLLEKRSSTGANNGSSSEPGLNETGLNLNTIAVDFLTLMDLRNASGSESAPFGVPRRDKSSSSADLFSSQLDDKWPSEMVDNAIRTVLRQSSLFSRVNILLIPQHFLRKFMLSAYDQSMANGMYTFINLPLLLNANEEQLDQASPGASTQAQPGANPKLSYTTSTGDNVFIWRSLNSTRNAQARRAFESLMSIYLRMPLTKAYALFSSRLSSLANTEYATTSAQASVRAGGPKSGAERARIHLNINQYSASFYDCLQIYATALDESLGAIAKATSEAARRELRLRLHSRISELVRNRRFENMVTGSIVINKNGDREVDYTLDDMNQMTGKYRPVMMYRGDTRELDRLARIQWSSDESVGPTVDSIECKLTNTCPKKPWSKFLVTLFALAAPMAVIMGSALFFVYKHISMESQLVDYWWRINYKDVEIVATRRKQIGHSSSAILSGADGSVESSLMESSRARDMNSEAWGPKTLTPSEFGKTTVVTKATDLSTLSDVCYGSIRLANYKLTRVALKPIAKFHQTRKLMIELRTIKPLVHNNLNRFVGIIVEKPHMSLVSEFCPKGSLREFFQNESMVIDWTFKYSIINDIMAGLTYLHSGPLEFHGRLKSSNCLVSSRFVVRLSDYGLPSLYDQLDETDDDFTQMRKQLYLAPENMRLGSKRCSKKGDIYSLGLILYEVVTNKIPFYNSDTKDYIMPLEALYNEVKARGVSEKVGIDFDSVDDPEQKINNLVELMRQCLEHNPTKRPTTLVVNTALKKITHGVTSKKLLENLTSRMEQYTSNLESLVDAKLAALVEEKQRTEELLYQFVPQSIASLLKEGQNIEPEAFECVTVFFSDIVGFTSLSSESTPMQVIDFLSDLYLCFDETLELYDIFKVETIGDAYIVASGLPQRNEGKHVMEIARAALDLRLRLSNFKIQHKPGRSLEMRVGIHSGPCVAGIVGGSNMPKYCVFGDTLALGKFMESSGLPMKIHVTEESKRLLDEIGGFKVEPRTPKVIKEGIPIQTYWLDGELTNRTD